MITVQQHTQPTKPVSLSKRTQSILLAVMVLMGFIAIPILLGTTAYFWEREQNAGQFAWEMVASRRIDLIIPPNAGFTIIKPNTHYRWGGITVDVNSHGLREAEIAYEKPADTVRVLNLGDSVAMGWGVRYENTYGKQLETLLNEQSSHGQRVEVINAGVPGWNLENELAFLQAEGMKYHPDLVLLDVTVVNDIYGDNALRASNRTGISEFLRKHTFSYSFLSIQKQWIEAHAAGKDRISVIDPPISADKYFPVNSDAPRWDDIWQNIAEMHKTAQNGGANFALVLFPLEFQVLDENFSTKAQDVLEARAESAEIPVVNLLNAYRETCGEKPGGMCEREDRYLFADVWMHPSALGHSVTARALLPVVENLLGYP